MILFLLSCAQMSSFFLSSDWHITLSNNFRSRSKASSSFLSSHVWNASPDLSQVLPWEALVAEGMDNFLSGFVETITGLPRDNLLSRFSFGIVNEAFRVCSFLFTSHCWNVICFGVFSSLLDSLHTLVLSLSLFKSLVLGVLDVESDLCRALVFNLQNNSCEMLIEIYDMNSEKNWM